jgi:hypothetical protein
VGGTSGVRQWVGGATSGGAGLTVVRAQPSTAEVGVPYVATWTASGGSPGYLFTLVGALPPGLTLSTTATVATISGTPTTAGTPTFGVLCTDTGGAFASSSRTVAVVAAVTLTRFASPFNRTGSDLVGPQSYDTHLIAYARHQVGTAALSEVRFMLDAYVFLTTNTIVNLGNSIQVASAQLRIVNENVHNPAITLGGATSWTVADGSYDNVSDAVLPSAFGLSQFAAGTEFIVIYDIFLPAGSVIHEVTGVDANNGTEAWLLNNGTTWTNSGSASTPYPTFSGGTSNPLRPPIIMLGKFVQGDPLTVLGMGDSIFALGDGQSYFCQTLKDQNIAGCQYGRIGGTGDVVATGARATHLVKYANTVVEEFNTNNAQAGVALSTLQNISLNAWAAIRAAENGAQTKPLRLVRNRLFTNTGSSDNWATTANQTLYDPWGLGQAVAQFHAWLPGQVGVGSGPDVISYQDLPLRASSDPTDPNFYLWAPSTNAVTTGIHLTQTGAEIAAQGLKAVLADV